MDKQRCLNISSPPATERTSNGVDETFNRSTSIRRCISSISKRFKKSPFEEFTPPVLQNQTENNCIFNLTKILCFFLLFFK